MRPGGDLGPDGADEVEFLLSANPGSPARSLARGASGGELSRVMLALEVVLADTAPVPTFVFDEIDAGIGGRAAVEVGRRLARLARTLAGARGHPPARRWRPSPIATTWSPSPTTARVTTSGVAMLDSAGRVRELSRMLAGLEDSEAAAAHAEELLELAAADRAGA